MRSNRGPVRVLTNSAREGQTPPSPASSWASGLPSLRGGVATGPSAQTGVGAGGRHRQGVLNGLSVGTQPGTDGLGAAGR